MAKNPLRQPRSNAFAFLVNLLKAWREFVRYNRSIRFMRRVHFNVDFVIYCLKKAARETAMGQRVSITLETAGGGVTIAVDTDQRSPSLTKEDELHQMWLNARNDRGP